MRVRVGHPVVVAVLLWGWAAEGLAARPVIFPNGVVSAVSFRPVGVPGSAIARGSLFSLFGTGLGPAAGVIASQLPLQTTLGGVSVRVTGGGTSVDAFPYFVRADQLIAILPSNAPLGQVAFTVSFQNETSDPVTVAVVASSFGIISRSSDGRGQAQAQNFVAPDTLPLNTLTNAARPGQVVIVYGTGLGAIAGPDNVAPPTADLNAPVEILVGGRPARRLYAGRSPCCAALDQVNFEVPPDAPAGCYVPVTIKTADTQSNYLTIAIAPSGGACTDPSNPLSGAMAGAGNRSVGAVTVQRSALQVSVAGRTILSTQDTAGAFFLRATESFFQPDFSLPPPGACSTLTFRATAGQAPFPIPLFALRDAGSPLRLSGPGPEKTIPRESTGSYFASLGGGVDLPGSPPPPPLYLVAGRYNLSGPGGIDIGALTANLDLPDPSTWTPNWTNRDQTATVNRAQPLSLTWTVGNVTAGVALITGSSTDAGLGVGGTFVCTAPLAAGSFQVPAAVLAVLPASTGTAGLASGMLSLEVLAHGASFTPPGLNLGAVRYRATISRLVDYR